MEITTPPEESNERVNRSKAGQAIGESVTAQTLQPTFAQWMEQGGMAGAIMQPGEASWASLKCGGGPHMSEFI